MGSINTAEGVLDDLPQMKHLGSELRGVQFQIDGQTPHTYVGTSS